TDDSEKHFRETEV
nr:Chain B, Protein Tax-1 [Human T-cell lymphotrophic virus type 1 (strain ATK)]